MLRQAFKLSETASVKAFEKLGFDDFETAFKGASRLLKIKLQQMPIISAEAMCAAYSTSPARTEPKSAEPAKPIINAGPVLPQKSKRRCA